MVTFDRAEGMLDRLAPLTHLFRMLIKPALHRLENVLMLPSEDQTFLGCGAAMLDGAVLAGVGPIPMQDRAFVLGRIRVGEPFAGRINILLSDVAEVLLAEAPFRL